MIDKPTAQKAVLEYLNTHYKVPNDELIIVDSLDKEYGWIFFYDSRQYLESHDKQYAIAGNAPVAVEKSDGSLHFLNTVQSVEEMIADYEKRRQNR